MSVIIRLQNLAWSANALDIRQFFRGLSIPEGGVHIVGGELGDAFIAFSTDEDARQAMMHDGGKIKEMKIKLLLSSRTEMQKVIEAARQQTLSLQSFMQTAPVAVAPVVQKPGSPGDRREKEKDNDSESSKDPRRNYWFSFDHQSQATSGTVSTWMILHYGPVSSRPFKLASALTKSNLRLSISITPTMFAHFITYMFAYFTLRTHECTFSRAASCLMFPGQVSFVFCSCLFFSPLSVKSKRICFYFIRCYFIFS